MRPFDFMVPFWGRRYRDYWVDLSLPSLLAPNNLPLLDAADGHRFLIATTEEDWCAICDLPIMAKLRQHAIPTWLKIELQPVRESAHAYDRYVDVVRQQNEAQKRLITAAGARRCYGSMLFPDVLYSDGTIAALLRLARAGYQAAFLPAMRQVEEDVLAELKACGYLANGQKLSVLAEPLTIPPRKMADLAVRHLHPEMELYDQGRPVQRFTVPFRYWRVDGGLILHTFYGCLPFIDYAAMPPDHASCLDEHALEEIYASRNFAAFDRIHVVADSDEFAVTSLTPRNINWSPPDDFAPWYRWLPGFARELNIRQSMRAYAGNDCVRRDLFLTPVRWHARDVDEHWREQEQYIAQTLRRAIGDYMLAAKRGEFPSRATSIDLIGAVLSIFTAFFARAKHIALRARRLAYRLATLARGDAAARHWLAWRFDVITGWLRGRKEHAPAPGLRNNTCWSGPGPNDAASN